MAVNVMVASVQRPLEWREVKNNWRYMAVKVVAAPPHMAVNVVVAQLLKKVAVALNVMVA